MKTHWIMFLTAWFGHFIPMFFGLGMGPSNEQKTAQSVMSGVGTYGINQGEKNSSQASDFWSSILSGNHDAIMRVLGPQITNIKAQGQQQKQTAAQFGNRSGGTNANLQMVDDNVHKSVDDLISSLTGTAASHLESSGLNLLGLGEGATSDSFNAASLIQKLKAAKYGDIFSSIADIAGGVAGFPGVAGSTTGRVLTGVGGILKG